MNSMHYIFILFATIIFLPKLLIQWIIHHPYILPVKNRELIDPDLDAHKTRIQNKENQGKVIPKRMLTVNEAFFYDRLKKALPEYDVVFQVAMGALISPAVSEDDPDFWATMKSYHGQMIDFVLARKGSHKDDKQDAVLVIELDDWSHEEKREKDARRDQRLASAGYPTIRWESRDKPDINRIRKEVGEKLGISLQPLNTSENS